MGLDLLNSTRIGMYCSMEIAYLDQVKTVKISIVGLGYVGLPLARLFATKYPVVGYDTNLERVHKLRLAQDVNLEIDPKLLYSVLKTKNDTQNGLYISNQLQDINDSNIYIVTVPTPVDSNNLPDLTYIRSASEAVAKVLNKGDVVVYESTVYPGATENYCVPILEKISNLKFNVDFFVGYSPERINVGDKKNTIENITKITSGSTPETGRLIDEIYKSVIGAGTYLVSSIKVAEAAKVAENSQRDINIAFVNELTKIFDLLEIDIQEVLAAAKTKWNFLDFRPGLVGGHCIPIDPYYMAKISQNYNYYPEVILAGRRVNESMSGYWAKQLVEKMKAKNMPIRAARLLLLGITFKENCPDIRNSKVVDIVNILKGFGLDIFIFDPWADPKEVFEMYQIGTSQVLYKKDFDVIMPMVAHDEFYKLDLASLGQRPLIYDPRSIFGKTNLKSN